MKYIEYKTESLKLNNESSPGGLNVELRVTDEGQVIIQIGHTCTLRLDNDDADQLAMAIKTAQSIAEQLSNGTNPKELINTSVSIRYNCIDGSIQTLNKM